MFFKSEERVFNTGRPGPHVCQGRDNEIIISPTVVSQVFPTGPHLPINALSLLFLICLGQALLCSISRE